MLEDVFPTEFSPFYREHVGFRGCTYVENQTDAGKYTSPIMDGMGLCQNVQNGINVESSCIEGHLWRIAELFFTLWTQTKLVYV